MSCETTTRLIAADQLHDLAVVDVLQLGDDEAAQLSGSPRSETPCAALGVARVGAARAVSESTMTGARVGGRDAHEVGHEHRVALAQHTRVRAGRRA